MLVVLKLVKTGARWGQQHNISGYGDRSRAPERGFQGLRVFNFNLFNLGLDLFCCGADGVNPLYPFA
jgi:hypothetical protein